MVPGRGENLHQRMGKLRTREREALFKATQQVWDRPWRAPESPRSWPCGGGVEWAGVVSNYQQNLFAPDEPQAHQQVTDQIPFPINGPIWLRSTINIPFGH